MSDDLVKRLRAATDEAINQSVNDWPERTNPFPVEDVRATLGALWALVEIASEAASALEARAAEIARLRSNDACLKDRTPYQQGLDDGLNAWHAEIARLKEALRRLCSASRELIHAAYGDAFDDAKDEMSDFDAAAEAARSLLRELEQEETK